MRVKLPQLLLSVAIPLAVGFASSFFTVSSISVWYTGLNKPVFSPPNWVFAPVWTILYFLMGISLYLVWISKDKNKNRALNIFFVQLGLNFLWSVIFFALKNPSLALLDIAALWGAVFLTIKHFNPISKTASNLLIPYLIWISFASLLNLAIVLLN